MISKELCLSKESTGSTVFFNRNSLSSSQCKRYLSSVETLSRGYLEIFTKHSFFSFLLFYYYYFYYYPLVALSIRASICTILRSLLRHTGTFSVVLKDHIFYKVISWLYVLRGRLRFDIDDHSNRIHS